MSSVDDDAAKAAAAGSPDVDADAARAARIAAEQVRAEQAARVAALTRAEEAEWEAATAQADLDAATARLRAAQERAAAERAVAAPPSTEDADADASHHGDGGLDNPPHQDALLQQEAVVLNLHAQAVSVQNIRTLVPLLLDVNSSFYARWKESFLDILGKYSLGPHVLSDAVAPSSPSWVRMNCVVRTWLLGAISDDLADIVSQRGTSARNIWLSIES